MFVVAEWHSELSVSVDWDYLTHHRAAHKAQKHTLGVAADNISQSMWAAAKLLSRCS